MFNLVQELQPTAGIAGPSHIKAVKYMEETNNSYKEERQAVELSIRIFKQAAAEAKSLPSY